jgi:hypothetical protein
LLVRVMYFEPERTKLSISFIAEGVISSLMRQTIPGIECRCASFSGPDNQMIRRAT